MTGVEIAVGVAAIVGAAASTAAAVHSMTQGVPKPPELPTPPAPPSPVPDLAPKAMEGETPGQRARKAQAKARTTPRSSTLLTGALGATQSQSAVKTTILGGNRA